MLETRLRGDRFFQDTTGGITNPVYAATGNTYIVTDLSGDLTNEFRLVQSGNSITVDTTGNLIIINATTGVVTSTAGLVQSSLTISTVYPLSGGGNLSVNRVYAIDTAFLVSSGRTIFTVYPLSGGNNLSADRTFSVDSSFFVNTGRTITAGAGLTGGGNLSEDRTISLSTPVDVTSGGTGAGTAAGARTNLGLVIGTNVQAYDPTLQALAGTNATADTIPYYTGVDIADVTGFTAAGRAILDDTTAAAQRITLGVGTTDSPQFTAVNIGHATDTTLTRVSAGLAAIEGVNIVTETATQTLTNKTLTTPTLTNPTFAASSGVLATTLVSGICEGRLTLTSGTAITTADVTAATTMYFTPYKGDRIAVYDGTLWKLYSFTERSLALGTLLNATNYDVFIYDNAGTLTLEFTAWTNNTTRATALVLQDGVYVRSGATTRRYLGTFRTTATTTTEDSLVKRFVWNMYNRTPRVMRATDSTNTWTYTTAAFREFNGATTNRLQFVVGLSEDRVTADCAGLIENTSATIGAGVGIGLDVTDVSSAQIMRFINLPAANVRTSVDAFYRGYPGIGFHFLSALEYSGASGTATWYGDGNAPTILQSGIYGELFG